MAVAPELTTPHTPLPTLSPSSLEQYLLLVLSDSNLPTGGFVASSGLESWIQHGYAALQADASPSSTSTSPPRPSSTSPGPEGPLLGFVRHSLHSYARLNVPLLCAAHRAVSSVSQPDPPSSAHPAKSPTNATFQTALDSLVSTDALCEALTLNHVARRASIAQGVALLTLYERAFSPPPSTAGTDAVRQLVTEYRNKVRKGEDGACGHMSVAFAVLTAAVGVTLGACGGWLSRSHLSQWTRAVAEQSRYFVRRLGPSALPLPPRPLPPLFRRPTQHRRSLPRAPHAPVGPQAACRRGSCGDCAADRRGCDQGGWSAWGRWAG